ncbi:MAG: hypothetical protein IJW62_07245, partial [Clostridia bacterium]|nr:hypothetical protein [Clostridia bacterium]
ELYGFTAVLNPGDSDNYGDTEGTLNQYGALYIQPTLPENSESGRAIVQVYDVAGDRVSIDIVESGELLIRRFADGNYTVTVSEQNRYFNSAERLAQFTTCGWTAGEDYYRTSVKLIAPCYRVLEAETPLAPDSSFLIKRDPIVTRNDHVYNNWQLYNWPYYTELTFDVILDTSFQLRNTTLLLSVPANMDLFHICQAEQAFGTHMTYSDRYLSEDGKTMYYEYPIGDLTQRLGRLQLMVYLRYAEDIISLDQITDQYCTLTIITDATVDGTASRYYAPAGSINMLDKDMLSYLVYVSHAPTISDKTGISAMVTAPAGSEVDLYADGELVAQGITNYTGVAVLRYDAPFEWIWWEYEVYAVVRLANTEIEFTTAPVSVECNEDLSVPVEITGEIVIREADTGKVVFPTSYDPDNIISVSFQTGERKNIALRSELDSTKLYHIYENYRVSFDNNAMGYARDVAIVIRYRDEMGNEKEEYLWTEYNEDSDAYLSTKTIRNIAYDPATLLTMMQLPTHMGVEWETAADAASIVLMPGQIEALAERLKTSELTPFQELFCVEASLENTIYALMDPVKTDSMFAYYPAQMQADIISDYQYAQDLEFIASSAFAEAFGFRPADMNEEDYYTLMTHVKSGTIDESVTAASLRQRGFIEIPVYGEDSGVFMTNTDSGLEIYDFSANYHLTYDTEAWMDVFSSYTPAQHMQVMAMRAMALDAGESAEKSLSEYVEGIHDEYIAKLIDTTYKQYLENKEFFEGAVLSSVEAFCTWIAKGLKEYYDDSIFDYLWGDNNPWISAAKDYTSNLIGEGLSFLKDQIPEKWVDWDWDKDRLINQYYDENGNLNAEVTEEGQNYLQENGLEYISGLLDEYATNKLSTLTGTLLEKGVANVALKGYDMKGAQADAFVQQYFNGAASEARAGGLVMKFDAYTEYASQLTSLERDGIMKVSPIMDPTNPEKVIAVKLDSNIKGISNSEAFALGMNYNGWDSSSASGKIYRAFKFKNDRLKELEGLDETKRGKFYGAANRILSFGSGMIDVIKEISDTFEALDRMRADYEKYANEMLQLGKLYANVDRVYQATLQRDEENMEYFDIFPLYQSSMTDQYGIGSIASDEYGSRLAFNMIFEGQAFVWMPVWNGYYDPEKGEAVITDKLYKRFTVRTYLNDFVQFSDGELDEYFKDSKTYYVYESPLYFDYLSDVKMGIFRAMSDLERLCNQYDKESRIEVPHMFTKLIGLTSNIPVPAFETFAEPLQLLVDTAIDATSLIGLSYTQLYSKANTNQYNYSISRLKNATEKLEELKKDVSTKGDNGDGVWKRNGIRYVSFNKAMKLWDEMAKENWYNLMWYPSGLENGQHWEDDPSSVEGEDVAEDMIFTEEEVASGLNLDLDFLGDTVSYEMECSDPLIDPAGFVYEAVLSNRVEGATVSIYYKDENGNAVLWDAENYGQISTVTTESGGYYSWMTPPGQWLVIARKDGYRAADTTADVNAVDGWLPVPPPQLDVNLGLVTTKAPIIAAADGYPEGVLIQFSQYMDIAGFDGTVTLTIDGKTVPCVLTFTDKEVSATDANVYYGRKLMVSRQDGQPLVGTVQVTVDGSVQNYAGIALGRDYTSEELTVKQYVSLIDMTYTNVTVKPAETVTVEGRLLDAFGNPVAGRRIILSSNEVHADLLNEIVYTDQNGYFTFSVKGIDVGFTVVDIHPDDSAVDASVTVETERITALNQYTDS